MRDGVQVFGAFSGISIAHLSGRFEEPFAAKPGAVAERQGLQARYDCAHDVQPMSRDIGSGHIDSE